MKLARILGCSLLLASIPLAAAADTQYVRYAPISSHWFPSVYVHTGASIDIALVDGDSLSSAAIVADPRWHMTSVVAANTAHVILKPSEALPDVQLLTIPGARHEYHVLLRSGIGKTTVYVLNFFQPTSPRRAVAVVPPPRKPMTVAACAAPLYSNYRLSGDKRIGVSSVCDDGVRTYVILDAPSGPAAPAAVPYCVDAGGHQDQIMNPSFDSTLHEWILDGVFEHLALVADSSRGQIRKNLDRVTK
jgi:type IV secretory pathway VirB9-like protein